jgi:hypothetical protein
MVSLFKDFLLIRLLNKVKGLSLKQIYELSVNAKERVYSLSVLVIIGGLATFNYAFTMGLSSIYLYMLLGFLILTLSLGVLYYINLYWILKDYLLYMLRPVVDDLDRPEIYFKRLLSSEVDLPKTENKND